MIAELSSLIDPIVKTLTVGADAKEAFQFFTGQFGTWWPVHDPKYTGKDATEVTLEPKKGGRIFATFKSGEERTWGIIQDFEPGARISFYWGTPISTTEKNGVTQVSVEFRDEGNGQCTVTLTHSDWDRLAEEALETRNDYDEGWDHVLEECFATYVRQSAD